MGDIIWKSAFNFFSLRLYSFKSPGRDIRVLGKMSCPITLQPDCTLITYLVKKGSQSVCLLVLCCLTQPAPLGQTHTFHSVLVCVLITALLLDRG